MKNWLISHKNLIFILTIAILILTTAGNIYIWIALHKGQTGTGFAPAIGVNICLAILFGAVSLMCERYEPKSELS